MNRPPFPACIRVTDYLLVGELGSYTTELPAATVEGLRAAGVNFIINLLSKEQASAAGPEALWGGLTAAPSSTTTSCRKFKILVMHCLWSEGKDVLPTARQVRLTLDEIDDAHAVHQTVFVNGAGHPARAVVAAGCWLARHGSGPARHQKSSPQAARLGWLKHLSKSPGGGMAAWRLDDEERAFVCAWPSGRDAEPVLTPTELLDEAEVYPTATADYWLRVLPTVRVYPEGRDARGFEVPVVAEKRVSDANINLELYDLHAGTWIGERTLRLLNGAEVVFISPFEKERK